MIIITYLPGMDLSNKFVFYSCTGHLNRPVYMTGGMPRVPAFNFVIEEIPYIAKFSLNSN